MTLSAPSRSRRREKAAGDDANKLIVRDADTGAEKHAFEHGGTVYSVAFSPDGKWLAAGDNAKR